jgi:hypothetical protein
VSGQDVRVYRVSRWNALFGIALGGALAGAWVWLLRTPAPTGAMAAKAVIAMYVGWIIPAFLLSVHSYQLIAHPAVLVLDAAGLRRRAFMRETLVCWDDVAGVVVHRHGKLRKVDVALRAGERTEAERVRAAALAGPWVRVQERGTRVRIENGLTILPLEEIGMEIAARARPPVEPVAVDHPTAKRFNAA